MTFQISTSIYIDERLDEVGYGHEAEASWEEAVRYSKNGQEGI